MSAGQPGRRCEARVPVAGPNECEERTGTEWASAPACGPGIGPRAGGGPGKAGRDSGLLAVQAGPRAARVCQCAAVRRARSGSVSECAWCGSGDGPARRPRHGPHAARPGGCRPSRRGLGPPVSDSACTEAQSRRPAGPARTHPRRPARPQSLTPAHPAPAHSLTVSH
jgi:hypothetical protein